MKVRLVVALGAAVLISTAGSPGYAHDDGKGNVIPPSLEEIQHEFENVVASRAQDDSDAPSSFAPCVNGMAAKTFPCKGVDMMSHLTLEQLGLSFANDIWGWTDPLTAREYAMIGGIEGTVFVDITDAMRPDVVGILPTHSTEGGDFWRDIKVYADHAYIVSENRGHGMQVFDLSRLRGVTGDPVTFTEDYDYAEVSNTHNLAINEDTGYAYLVGSDTCAGGLHMVDLSEPGHPVFAGCYATDGYIHDTQCVIYDGTDADHRGREICFNSAAQDDDSDPNGILNAVSVTDVTDKSQPVRLDRYEYPTDGYSHQGWLTPDQRYFLHNDELDEVFHGLNTTTRIFDMRDLDDIVLRATTANSATSIGHNMYTEGDRVYASNYTSGLRVFDTSRVSSGELPEVGYFDLYPANDNASFEGGTWSNYPYYQQDVIAVSSMDRGLFVLKPRGTVGG